jgi:hypothetical protein
MPITRFSPLLRWLNMFAATMLVSILASAFAFGQTEYVVHRFKGGSDGARPYATPLADSAGNLYGTTFLGGGGCSFRDACGTVYELTPGTGGHWTETILHVFNGTSDGWGPTGGLVFDQAGNLYGTNFNGGKNGYGTVFQLTPPVAGGAWGFNVIHDLASYNNGYPVYPVVGQSGDIYFEEPAGGAPGLAGLGCVSRLIPPAQPGGAWIYTQIYVFKDWPDGVLPIGTLAFDKEGNLYGVTAVGGNALCNGYGCGTVFELVRPNTRGGAWTKNLLYVFQGIPDGQGPYSGVIFDTAGNLYGTTQEGGANGAYYGGYGTVYQLSPPSQTGGAWTETVLYSFQGTTDGGGPRAALIRDVHNNLYGTTITPTVFELSPPSVSGGSWTETTLHQFGSGNDGGGEAYAGLTYRLPGTLTLYGATLSGGGQANDGVVFALQP